MRRRQSREEWRLHRAKPEEPAGSELSPAISDLPEADQPGAAQSLREELVDGLHRAELLQRIRDHFAAEENPEHLRYTRRAWLELQGRRHTPRHATYPPN